MKKEKTEPTEVEAEEQSFDLEEILSKLIPPDNIEILDIFGNEYSRPAVVPARRQVKLIRSFQEALNLSSGKSLADEADVASMIDFIVEIATDEKVVEKLGECFTHAFPDVVKEATSYAKEKKIKVDKNASIDLFSIEDIAGSIIPLFIRLAKKSGGAVKVLNNLL